MPASKWETIRVWPINPWLLAPIRCLYHLFLCLYLCSNSFKQLVINCLVDFELRGSTIRSESCNARFHSQRALSRAHHCTMQFPQISTRKPKDHVSTLFIIVIWVRLSLNFDHKRKVISEYDPNYSAMSLDEAYLDITEHLIGRVYSNESERTFPKFYKSLGDQQDTEMDTECNSITFGTDTNSCVNEIRHRIYLATNLTASAGIACNLRLAKLCSDVNKPNGQFRLESDTKSILDFVEPLPIRKMNGIGPSTALILDCYGIKACKDIYEKRGALYLLETQNSFEFLMNVCRGLGSNRISHEHEKKSLGHET